MVLAGPRSIRNNNNERRRVSEEKEAENAKTENALRGGGLTSAQGLRRGWSQPGEKMDLAVQNRKEEASRCIAEKGLQE